MAEKVKVGMIGLRGWGNIVRNALAESETLELAAVWSRDRESIERSQKELPSKVCESYEALLGEPIDAVLIINPNFVHLEYALKAADAGKAIRGGHNAFRTRALSGATNGASGSARSSRLRRALSR